MVTVPPSNVRNGFGGLQIRLLGGLLLFVHEAPVKFAAPLKASALLGYLIVNRSRAMPRDATAYALWPDEEEAKARANLRRHIALLQHVLPACDPPAIIADQRSIRWNSDFDPIVDVCEFERLSAKPDGAPAAVALYGGDLLPALYDDWLMPERERLRMLQSANLERLIEAYRRDGDYPNAVHTGRMLLDHDPWREDTVRRIMMLRMRRVTAPVHCKNTNNSPGVCTPICKLRRCPKRSRVSKASCATRPCIWPLPGRPQLRLLLTSCPLSVGRRNSRACTRAGCARFAARAVPSS